MPQPEQLDPSPYAADGGPVGVLLVHGFGGSVAETRPMGEYLAERGLTVDCPLLSGHGTVPEDLIGIRWQAWAQEVGSALRNLQGRCDTVVYCGLSLGSLLGLWLGAAHPEVAGLVLLAPAVKVRYRLISLTVWLRYLLKYPPPGIVKHQVLGDPEAYHRLWCYDKVPMWGGAEIYLLQRHVREAVTEIRQPVLIMQGCLDSHLAPQVAHTLYDGVASADKTLVWLENSGHNILVDGEREKVWAQSYEWMMRVLGSATGAPA